MPKNWRWLETFFSLPLWGRAGWRLRALRITVLGEPGPGRLAESFSYALTRLGQAVSAVSDRSVMPESRFGRLLARKRPGLSGYFSNRTAQLQLAEDLVATRPDLVLAVKSPYVQPIVIDHVRARTGCRVFNWYPDNPFVKYGQTTPHAALRHYDRVIVFSPSLAARVKREVGVDAQYIPFGFDPRYFFPPRTPRVAKADVAFVGQCRPERAALLTKLVDSGFTVRVAGPDWDAAPARVRSSWHGAPSWGADAGRFYHEARAGLNDLHRQSNGGSHNMRTWEIPATATAMVTTDSAQQRQLLQGVPGVAYYTGLADLPAAVEDAIASSAASQPVDFSAHTYQERCRELIAAL